MATPVGQKPRCRISVLRSHTRANCEMEGQWVTPSYLQTWWHRQRLESGRRLRRTEEMMPDDLGDRPTACKPTRVEFCDFHGGQIGDLAWYVMYEFMPGKWAPLSIPFATESEARDAEIVLRGERSA